MPQRRHWIVRFALILVCVSPTAAAAATGGDFDGDGDTDLADFLFFAGCFTGAGSALEPGCEEADFDGDDDVDLADLLAFQDRYTGVLPPPPTHVTATSPAPGEGGVAVTRETIVHFSAPVDPDTVNESTFFAMFGGAVLPGRVHVSASGLKATLFYTSDPLPASARVRITVVGDGILDTEGEAVDVDVDGEPGGVLTFDFDTLTLTTIAGTTVCGRVCASELGDGGVNVPLRGVTITADGMEDDVRALTDEMGNFCLTNAPAGRFFVHINGQTAENTPDGFYYPFVGKAWESRAGQTVNIGTVHLPAIADTALAPVSDTEDVEVAIVPEQLANVTDPILRDALQAVHLTVPANSLFADDGTRGGSVGIAPVPPDRLPGTLPEGLVFPLVITVQTDGPTNFDVPAPVCFPNLPDPLTGAPLPPGTQDFLYSFNHDKGIWEAIGPMTVADDGVLLCTDPGVGILAPGWHGTGPPPVVSPPPPPCGGCCDAGGGGGGGPAGLAPAAESASDKCHRGCTEGAGRCIRNCVIGAVLCITGCALATGPGAPLCLGLYVAANLVCLGTCTEGVGLCNEGCDEDHGCHSGGGNDTAPAGSDVPGVPPVEPNDPIVDEIANDVRQIIDLIGTYALAGQEIPPDVLEQVTDLLAHANDAAGGDAVAFLQNQIRASEQRSAALGAEIGQPEAPGNAPPYPVLYMTQIPRPGGGGALHLRGQTGGFGTYTLFVPRDRTLAFVSLYDPREKAWGIVHPRVTDPLRLPRFYLQPVDETFPDFDGDGLADAVEAVYGTEINNPDTDGDGIRDGAEVDQGLNPLDGLPTRTGVIATADTPGRAVDVCAVNNVAIVADSLRGISVFNVFNGMDPLVIAQVDTPGSALAVACSGSLIAVADGAAGLAVIDIADPPVARIAYQVPLGGTAQAVTTAGHLAYVGATTGQITAVDMRSGTILDTLGLPAAIQDVVIEGDVLYAMTEGALHTLPLRQGPLEVVGTASSPGGINIDNGRGRLFVGGGVAYAVHRRGYNTIDVRDPENPILITATETPQFGWKHIVLNGSGLGVAAVSPNQAFDGPHNVSLYNVADPTQTDGFLTEFETPGVARAVAIYNGLAYVADHENGLQVVNYLRYDTQGVPPTIALDASFSLAPVEAEEGKLVRVTAAVSDDVQVRNVEFFVDGALVATDGNFPFEHRFTTPLLAEQTSFTLRARATDTGRNTTMTDEIVVLLIPDATPPRVTSVSPSDGATVGATGAVAAFFSEPIAPTTLNDSTFHLVGAGADGLFDTPDDEPVAGGVIDFDLDVLGAFLRFAAPLPPERYRARVTTGVADLTGNPLGDDVTWTFTSFDVSEDRDGDCVPDVLEPALGLDPDDPDTDGDGIPDGDEDFDQDGLSNCGEVVLVTDATDPDTDGDGIADGDEDLDGDGLSDGEEFRRGTDPDNIDTDGDGWHDSAEVETGSDPLDPRSRPPVFVVASPAASAVAPGASGLRAANVTVALPSTSVLASGIGNTGGRPFNTTVSQPPTSVVLPGPASAGPLLANTAVALPPVSVEIEN